MRLDTIIAGARTKELQFITEGEMTTYTILGSYICHKSDPVPIPPLLNNTLPGLNCTTPQYQGTPPFLL